MSDNVFVDVCLYIKPLNLSPSLQFSSWLSFKLKDIFIDAKTPLVYCLCQGHLKICENTLIYYIVQGGPLKKPIFYLFKMMKQSV